ncbi:MAG: carbohydrate kinase [Microbacteriaceae bacterium]|nr:carbohydrate kinase [Microbacteriaceae bacterium]
MIGEALVDVVEGVALPGGSPLNVAVGLARLGVPTTLHTAFGTDAHGELIAQRLAASGVEVTPGSRDDRPTSVALAEVGPDGAARYRFELEWDPAPVESAGYELVHTGSIGAALPPGAEIAERALADATGLVSFDPNIRPALMPDRASALARVERLVAASDVVKASDEDLAWLYPRLSIAEVLSRWAAAGPRLVVVTRGGEGADALADGAALHVDVPPVAVADTIGAGDSFMAGLLAAVLELGFDEPKRALEFAARCAAVTVSRPGADPPWTREVGAPGGSPS